MPGLLVALLYFALVVGTAFAAGAWVVRRLSVDSLLRPRDREPSPVLATRTASFAIRVFVFLVVVLLVMFAWTPIGYALAALLDHV